MKNGSRRILVTGHFGSGKTEFAVSLSFALSEYLGKSPEEGGFKESKLSIADLDIENPYFRSRERQDDLVKAGLTVYSDPFGGRNGSELQTIDARIFAPVEDHDCRIIMDTGGDKSGAMVLNQFSRHFHDDDGYQLLSVVNCNRPGTDTVEKAVEQINAVEAVTGLKITGLVSNAHLIRFTTAEDVINGYNFTKQVSEVTGIPVVCACAMTKIAKELEKMKAAGQQATSADDIASVFAPGETCADMEVFPIGMYMRDSYLDKQV